MQIRPRKIIVTTNYSIHGIYDSIQDLPALQRRFIEFYWNGTNTPTGIPEESYQKKDQTSLTCSEALHQQQQLSHDSSSSSPVVNVPSPD